MSMCLTCSNCFRMCLTCSNCFCMCLTCSNCVCVLPVPSLHKYLTCSIYVCSLFQLFPYVSYLFHLSICLLPVPTVPVCALRDYDWVSLMTAVSLGVVTVPRLPPILTAEIQKMMGEEWSNHENYSWGHLLQGAVAVLIVLLPTKEQQRRFD